MALIPNNPHIAKMTVTATGPSTGNVHAKLYKDFPPTNVSGPHSAWYYIPSSFKVPTGT